MEEVRIERLAAGGDGVGRLGSGLTVFVPFTAPGDLVRVRVVQRRRRFARAEVDELVEAGPDRRSPVCSVFGVCGGCAWQHLDYAAQLDAKRSILADALERIGGCRLSGEPDVVASPEPYGYRGRARLLVRGGRVGYRERRSHRLCAVTECPILAPPLRGELARLAERAAEEAPARASGDSEEWEIALGSGGETRASTLGRDDAAGDGSAASPRVVLRAGGDEISISAGTFAQANVLLWEALWQAVQQAVGEGEALLELYGGAGFFGLGFARRFGRVRIVESGATAVADLRRNLAAAGLAAIEVDARRVEEALEAGVAIRPDAVFLDPPRSGLAPGAAERLCGLGADRIVYLSCDPATLARDVALMERQGYRLDAVTGFDLFPQTPHVEALARLVLR